MITFNTSEVKSVNAFPEAGIRNIEQQGHLCMAKRVYEVLILWLDDIKYIVQCFYIIELRNQDKDMYTMYVIGQTEQVRPKNHRHYTIWISLGSCRNKKLEMRSQVMGRQSDSYWPLLSVQREREGHRWAPWMKKCVKGQRWAWKWRMLQQAVTGWHRISKIAANWRHRWALCNRRMGQGRAKVVDIKDKCCWRPTLSVIETLSIASKSIPISYKQ